MLRLREAGSVKLVHVESHLEYHREPLRNNKSISVVLGATSVALGVNLLPTVKLPGSVAGGVPPLRRRFRWPDHQPTAWLGALTSTLRAAVRWFTASILFVSLAALAGCSTAGIAPSLATGPAVATVYVVDRGWHTDICLAADYVRGPLAAVKQTFPGVRYLSFGFGERAFYESRHTDLFTMLRALLPSRAAILVTALRVAPADAFGRQHVVALPLTAAERARLDAFLWSYLRKRPDDEPQVLAPGPYAGSLFYAALGTYDAAFTCNTWTADGLHIADLPISAEGVLFAGQVMGRVRALALLTGRRLPVGAGGGRAWRNDDSSMRRRGRRVAAAEAETATQQERKQQD